MRPRLLATLVAVTLTGAPPALSRPVWAAAVPPADAVTQRARDEFREGQKHYNLGEFGDALQRFKEAYRIKPDPVLLYNIGQCQWKMGDLKAAVHSYRGYLRGAGDVPNRREVEARIAELEQKLHDQDVGAAAAPPVSEPVPPPPGAAPPPLAPMPVMTATAATEPEQTPLTHKWWFWTGVGAVVVAGVVTAVLLSRDPTDVPSTTLGSKGAF